MKHHMRRMAMIILLIVLGTVVLICLFKLHSKSTISNIRPSVESDSIIIYYSTLKGYISNVGSDVIVRFPEYNGKTIAATATIDDVLLKTKSPSFSKEDDVARFRLDLPLSISNHLSFQSVVLKFDQHNAGPFVQGSRWKLVFTEDGQLISLEPFSGN